MDLRRSVASVVVVVVSLIAVPLAAAQSESPASTIVEPPAPTSAPDTTATSTPQSTVPGSSTTTSSVPDSETTTTTVYIPPIPPELEEDPRLPFLVDPGENDGLDIPIAQRSFDPLSVGVLPARISESKIVLGQSLAALSTAIETLEARKASVAALESSVNELSAATKAAVERAAGARQKLRDHAVVAYTNSRSDPMLSIVEMSNVADVGVAKQYMSAIMTRQDRLLKDYEEAREKLSRDNASLAENLGIERSRLTEDQAAVDKATEEVRVASEQLAAYEAGAHAYIDGFVFPVAADAEFIDSWGYPRMMGTSSAHWHQGADIFASYNAPVIASENGVIDRLGQASLGGNKLWVKGASGTSYYYAHLSAFAPGMVNGKKVRAGEVVGFVGDTGNAKGTSPHLHFEVHPAGSDVVNAYPLLRAAYGNRPAFRAVAPPLPPPPSIPAPDAEVAGLESIGG